MANHIILLLCVSNPPRWTSKAFQTYTINLFGKGKLVYNGRTKKHKSRKHKLEKYRSVYKRNKAEVRESEVIRLLKLIQDH